VAFWTTIGPQCINKSNATLRRHNRQSCTTMDRACVSQYLPAAW